MFNKIVLVKVVFSSISSHFKLAILWKFNEIFTHISSCWSLWMAWTEQIRPLNFISASAHWNSRSRFDVYRDRLQTLWPCLHVNNFRTDDDFDRTSSDLIIKPRFFCMMIYLIIFACNWVYDCWSSCTLLSCGSGRESFNSKLFFGLIVNLCWVAATLCRYGSLKKSLLTLKKVVM